MVKEIPSPSQPVPDLNCPSTGAKLHLAPLTPAKGVFSVSSVSVADFAALRCHTHRFLRHTFEITQRDRPKTIDQPENNVYERAAPAFQETREQDGRSGA